MAAEEEENMTKEEYLKNLSELPDGIQNDIVAKIKSGGAEEEEEVEEETEDEHNLRLKNYLSSQKCKKNGYYISMETKF